MDYYRKYLKYKLKYIELKKQLGGSGTKYYYCVVSLTSASCPTITTNTAEVIVVADPTITTQPLPTQTICIGGSGVLSVVYSNGLGKFLAIFFAPADYILPLYISYIALSTIVGKDSEETIKKQNLVEIFITSILIILQNLGLSMIPFNKLAISLILLVCTISLYDLMTTFLPVLLAFHRLFVILGLTSISSFFENQISFIKNTDTKDKFGFSIATYVYNIIITSLGGDQNKN